MDLVLSTNTLGLGGSESYLLTVAEQVDRLGHRVTLHARAFGPMADLARERGLNVVDDPGLPAACDGVLVQDAAVAFELAARYPEVPQVFVAHSVIYDLQSPPQLPGLTRCAVALNDRVANRLRSLAVELDVVRLHQPIDIERFGPGGPLPARPARLLLLSNRVDEGRRSLARACARNAIELTEVGVGGELTADPQAALQRAHIVVGYGRSVLEAMACGRAAFVFDHRGGDGWVTGERYEALEADGFAGAAGPGAVDPDALAATLAGYRPTMGAVNRDLVATHHRADAHAAALVELIAPAAAPARAERGPLDEMARLVRLQYRAQEQLADANRISAGLRAENDRLEAENAELRRALRSRSVRLATAPRRLLARASAALRRGRR